MIPKIIHYCWFGNKPLSKLALKCIESWKLYFPEYEIREWNESNFNVHCIPYTSEAYKASKYAFVSDYARFKILYEYGGLYFDTDVEVIKSFDSIIKDGAFMGVEITDPYIQVNPGLGLGMEAKNSILEQLLNLYSTLSFYNPDGSQNLTTIVEYSTNLLLQNGLKDIKGRQIVSDITIYPKEFFNPFDDLTGRLKITENTHSIHWFAKSWIETNKSRVWLSRLSHRLFGLSFSASLKKILNIK